MEVRLKPSVIYDGWHKKFYCNGLDVWKGFADGGVTDGFTHSERLYFEVICFSEAWDMAHDNYNCSLCFNVTAVLSLLVLISSTNKQLWKCLLFLFSVQPRTMWICSPSRFCIKISEEKKNQNEKYVQLFCAIKVICRFFFINNFLDVKWLKIWYVVLNNLWRFF